ncbi:MAG: acyl carrier protein [Terracidiphilus sp.]
MNNTVIESQVKEVLQTWMLVDSDALDSDLKLSELDVNFLDAVVIAMHLEDEFDIKVPHDDFSIDMTVGELVEYVQRRLEFPGSKDRTASVLSRDEQTRRMPPGSRLAHI